MSSIIWRNLAGQERVKEFLDSAFQKGTLGHAFLFCGEEGPGKFAAGIDLRCPLCTSVKTALARSVNPVARYATMLIPIFTR